MISQNAKGAIFITIAMATYATSDVLYKYVGATIPLSQFLFTRGMLISLIFFTVILMKRARAPQSLREWILICLRGFIEAALGIAFLTALKYTTVTELTVIMEMVPIILAVLGYFFYGEKFGMPRFIAIIAGFLGVILVLKPATGITLAQGLGLIAMALVVLREVVTRALPKDTSSLWVSLLTAVCVMSAGGLQIVPSPDWIALSTSHWLLLFGFAALMAGAYFFSILGVRNGEVSLVGMFRYSAVIFAAIGDWFVFGKTLDGLAWIGCAIITFSGLFVMHREAMAKRSLAQKTSHVKS